MRVRLKEAFHNLIAEVQACIQWEAAVLANMLGGVHRPIHSSNHFLQMDVLALPQRLGERGLHQSHLEKWNRYSLL